MWGFLTADTDSDAAKEYYQRAETSLREALGKNKNYRSARTYLVAVLSELDRQDEAVDEMAILRAMGRPQASQDPERFREYVQQTHPYEIPEIPGRLIDLWQAAER